jgi:hypothetical protein
MIEWTFFGDGLYPDFWFGIDQPTDFLFQDAPLFDDQFEIIVFSINAANPSWHPTPGIFSPSPTFPPANWTFTFFAYIETPIPGNAAILLPPGDYQVNPICNVGTYCQAYAALAPVPEPATWALLIAGFAVVSLCRICVSIGGKVRLLR